MVLGLILAAVGYLLLYYVIRAAVRDALREHRRAQSDQNPAPARPPDAVFRDPGSG